MRATAARQNFSSISPAQCRAARQLIGAKAEALAQVAGVSLGTVKAFEAGRRNIAPRTMRDLVEAFRKMGVGFDCRHGDEKDEVAAVSLLSLTEIGAPLMDFVLPDGTKLRNATREQLMQAAQANMRAAAACFSKAEVLRSVVA